MINIIYYKKSITVTLKNNGDNQNNIEEQLDLIEFTQKQLDLIKLKKVFLLYHKINKIIKNIPDSITHLVIQNVNFNCDICKYLPNQISAS